MSSLLTIVKSLFVWNELEAHLLEENGDSQLIVKHTSIKHIPIAVQPGKSVDIRVLSIPHYKSKELPALPTVVFLHGLGGQLGQFDHLIDYFAYFASVVAIDLPGHGKSEQTLDASLYTAESLLSIIEHVINSERPVPTEEDVKKGIDDSSEESAADTDAKPAKPAAPREFVLVGHSLGTALASRLAQKLGPQVCKGVVAICPPAKLSPEQEKFVGNLKYTPAALFNVFRSVDRVGGLNSPSVNRMIYKETPLDSEIRVRQLRWNLQVNTKPWMRLAANMQLQTPEGWGSLEMPVFLIAAEGDKVTPPANVDTIHSWLNPKVAALQKPVTLHESGHAVLIEKPQVLAGLLSDFISKHVDEKLSLGWQLAYIAAKSDKWSLKNEAKWRATISVGDVIDGTRLRGMKTLRQSDAEHSPAIIEASYPNIGAIIDISREPPPYDPETFTRIKYNKFPTVSKLPPTRKEVAKFIALVDKCLADLDESSNVAVHCHYGFNRTGFFLCSYMVERLGYKIKDAVDKFGHARTPGIKHPHFVDELYVRYDL